MEGIVAHCIVKWLKMILEVIYVAIGLRKRSTALLGICINNTPAQFKC